MIDHLKIAKEYAKKVGKDTIIFAGENNGFFYYHIFRMATAGHKLGIQQYLRIDKNGKTENILPMPEIMWARHQQHISNCPCYSI